MPLEARLQRAFSPPPPNPLSMSAPLRLRPARIAAALLAILSLLALGTRPALAQSILRDAETEALLHDMAAPLIEASELEPGNVDIVLVGDRSINAFVAGGQVVYINAGLIEAADTANEVQGVIAHELGHITGGHVLRGQDAANQAGQISILSMVLAAAAAAAGAGDAAFGIISAGQRAAIGKYLAFSRQQEAATDAAGARYLSAAGISGRGSLAFFGKLQNLEYRYNVSQADEAQYTRTHPMTGDRIAFMREVYENDPAWDAPEDAQLQARFERVKAKLVGYLAQPRETLRDYPRTDTSVPARYARAYAFHKNALIEEALVESEALIAAEPDNPYFHELKGQVLLESGRPEQALGSLRLASEMTSYHPLIASILGHALIATEDSENFAEAERVLRAAVGRDRRNPFAWYQLGVVYAERGDLPRAKLASAEQQVMSRQYASALRNATAAEQALDTGTPDWLRAQDIAFEARAALERERDRR